MDQEQVKMDYAVTRYDKESDNTVVAAYAQTERDSIEAVRLLMLHQNQAAAQQTDDPEFVEALKANMEAIETAEFVADVFGLVKVNGLESGYAVARMQ